MDAWPQQDQLYMENNNNWFQERLSFLDEHQVLLDTIVAAFHEHICPPTALASGFSGVPHKCASFGHMTDLETPVGMTQASFNDSVCSNTTDMERKLECLISR